MPKFEGFIHSKLPTVGTTIFTVMSKLAAENKAINLSQGFPDFNCDEKLVDLVHQYMKSGFNQYAPMQGHIQLREQISVLIENEYKCSYHPETEITVTAGATQAIYTSIAALVREGDEVIVFEPCYDCYTPAIIVAGAKPIYVPLQLPDFKINWTAVKKLITHRTRMIIINSPHNPTGAIITENDLKELDKITRNTDIIILSDEVYEHMVFDGKKHFSIATHKQLANRSLLVSSFGKTFHTTGWKMAYIAAPENLMNEFRKVHQYLVFSCNSPMQLAIAEYMKDENNYLQLKHFYQKKRDYFVELIKNSRFNFQPCQGTYFQLLDYKTISTEKDTDLAVRLTKEFKIASIPLSVFYHEKTDNQLLRFCFAKKEETLEKAAEIICKI